MKGYGRIYALLAAGMVALLIIAIVCREAREHKQRSGSWPTFGQFIGIEEYAPGAKRPK